MKTHTVHLTVVQKAAAKARVQKVTDNELLMLYMTSTTKQREDLFANTNRAAEIAALSRRTIQLWIGIGLVRAVRVGKQYRVSLDSLREYFQELIDD